ncbi:MAG: GAF domain-containing protein, partial [Dethiobacteria bacterium]
MVAKCTRSVFCLPIVSRFVQDQLIKSGKAFIAIPVISYEKVLGIIDLGSFKKRNFSTKEIEALSLMGYLLGSYI